MTAPHSFPDGNWKVLDKPRVEPLDHGAVSFPGRIVLALIRRRTGATRDFNVFRTFARLGGIFPAHSIFLSQILGGGRLPATEKELVILRVAWRVGCVYEWGHHSHMAAQLGVGKEEIDEIASEESPERTSRLGALLTMTDELIATKGLSDETWALGMQWASEDELLELCLLVGHYVMVAMTLNSVGVQLESEFGGRA